jgi:hypothetical protein
LKETVMLLHTIRSAMTAAVLAVCLMHAGLQSASAAAPPSGPVAPAQVPLMVEPPVVNFGVVAPGTKHPARFLLRNIGSAPLTIERAQPSCKCTDISDIAGKVIAPGATLELTASLLVPKSPGDKDAKVMITVAGYPGLVLANMMADVTQPIRAAPAFVDALKDKQEGVVHLSSIDGKPFKVTSAGGRAPLFVGFDPAKDVARAAYDIRWRVAEISPGALPQWWVIDTDRADCAQIPLRIRHESTGGRFDPERSARFWFPPESIVLAGVVKAGTPVALTTTIEHLNPAAQGRVTAPTWGDVSAMTVPGAEGTARFVSATKRAGDFVDIAFEFTAKAGRFGSFYIPVMIETPTGKGPVFVAVTVVP